MSKNSAAKAVTVITLASLNTEEQALQQKLAEIAAKKVEVRKTEMDKLTAHIDALPAGFSVVLGRPVEVSEIVSLINQRVKGTLGSLVSATSGDKGKRLSDETKVLIRADLLKHCGALKQGLTPEPLSVIAQRHGIQAQTLDTYKPTAAQVAALPGMVTVPASRMSQTNDAPAPAAQPAAAS